MNQFLLDLAYEILLLQTQNKISKFSGNYKERSIEPPNYDHVSESYLLFEQIAEMNDMLDLCIPNRRLSIIMVDDPLFRYSNQLNHITDDKLADVMTFFIGLELANLSDRERRITKSVASYPGYLEKLKNSSKTIMLWKDISKTVTKN